MVLVVFRKWIFLFFLILMLICDVLLFVLISVMFEICRGIVFVFMLFVVFFIGFGFICFLMRLIFLIVICLVLIVSMMLCLFLFLLVMMMILLFLWILFIVIFYSIFGVSEMIFMNCLLCSLCVIGLKIWVLIGLSLLFKSIVVLLLNLISELFWWCMFLVVWIIMVL